VEVGLYSSPVLLQPRAALKIWSFSLQIYFLLFFISFVPLTLSPYTSTPEWRLYDISLCAFNICIQTLVFANITYNRGAIALYELLPDYYAIL
jgi:hypothetical protein